MPLDTHTGRISQYIGLTRRKSLGWKAACEITDRLRECDAEDPVKYDFALARLGILDLCKRSYRAEICEKCELRPACKFANRSQKAKLAPLKRKAA
jgi:endonuclease III